MLSTYFNITVIAEWCTFTAAILLLDKKTKVWRLFILLFILIIATETTGWYLRTQMHQLNNALPFNLLMIVSTTFFIWFFTKTKYLFKIKQTLVYTGWIFALFAIINLFFFQGFTDYNAYSETLGDIMLSLICCYFLFTLLKDQEYINLLGYDYFWIATGILFYSMGSALLYQFSGVLREYYLESKFDIGTYINYGLNLILYTSLIIAFICRWKVTR